MSTSVLPLKNSNPALIAQLGAAPTGRGFDAFMTRASSIGAQAGRKPDQQLRQASQQLVSNALIQPVLRQMRHSPFRSKMFQGGWAEQAFAQKLDTILADRIVHSSKFPIVNEVYNSLHDRGTEANLGNKVNTHG